MSRKLLTLAFVFSFFSNGLFAQTNNCLLVDIQTTDAECALENGSISLNVLNGIPPYFHSAVGSIPAGQFNGIITFDNLPPAIYNIIVNDSDTCSVDLGITVGGNVGSLMIVDVITTDETCPGAADGTVEAIITGGEAPFAYSLLDPVLGNLFDMTSVSAGVYVVMVEDANGCIDQVQVVVGSGTSFTLSTQIENVSCFGSQNGVITVTPDPPGNYLFDWSPNVSSVGVLSDLPAGIYCITVSDVDSGCAVEDCITVTEPNMLSIELQITQPTGLGNDGKISALALGGTPGYSYQWNTGETSAVIQNLGPGIYSVTLVDANGCFTIEDNIELNAVQVDVVVTNVDCNGESTGSIELTPITGTAPYTYSWTGPNSFTSTDQNIYDLVAGTYLIEVTDANSDQFIRPIEVSENPEIFGAVSIQADCAGEDIIGIVTATGGIGNYIYDWDDLAGNNDPATRDDLYPGVFSVTITDGLGCSTVLNNIVVEDAPGPIVISFDVQNASCTQTDGCLTANVSGGTPSYLYYWITGEVSQTICNLAPGDYSLVVTDANGCTKVGESSVGVTGPPSVNITGSPVVCTNEGFIDVEISDGTPPYSFAWSDDPTITTPNRTDLWPGFYSVTIEDATNCLIVSSFEILSSIMLDLESTTADCDSTGGTATANVTGGATNPTYAWSNGETTASIIDLAPGGYSVTVTDPGPGCQRHENVIIALDSSCFVTIAGTVYLEEINQDCIADAGALGVAGILISLDNNQSTFTDSDGNYSFNVEPGIYAVSMVANNPQYAPLCAGPINVNVSTPMTIADDNDFFVEYGIKKDLKIYVNKGNARPGFTQSIQICVWNYGEEPADGILTFVHDPIQEFLSASPTEDNYDLATQTVTWTFTNLAPGGVAIFRPKVKLDATVPLGTLLNLNFEVTPIIGDETPWNNTIHCPMEVTGSYDPNDKTVTPGNGDAGTIYGTDTLLTYRIRFQNTGTDTAFTVVVKDTLQMDLDIETLIPGPSSHPYTLSVEDERTLVFTFDNIMLPDSFVNEPASNGFVFFDIRPIEGTTYGTVIENSAAIYFDFNPPVITNTTTTIFTLFVNTLAPEDFDLPLTLQPNPSLGEVMLFYSLEESQEVWINVYDMQGNFISTVQQGQRRSAGQHQVLIAENQLPAGVYLIRIETDQKLQGVSRMLRF